jgi:hypothetical protein
MKIFPVVEQEGSDEYVSPSYLHPNMLFSHLSLRFPNQNTPLVVN